MALDPFTGPVPPIAGLGFTGNPLDRADRLRQDPALLAQSAAHPEARLMVLAGLDPPLARDGLDWQPMAEAGAGDELLLLGLDAGAPRFALARPSAPGQRPLDLRKLAGLLSEVEAGIYAQARSMLGWHDRHRHCAVCGAPTRAEKGGYLRRCTSGMCGAEHFPRTDPVTIMLVIDGDRCLLGRKKEFPRRSYSALAGFLEPGETIEDAVRREVMEEAGIRCGQVRYVASQPWPFPSSLMIGCFAEALSDAITIDSSELEDVQWFDLDACEAALAGHGPFVVAPPLAIAHHLLKAWVELRR
jgi:NAD+ diphosphatase